MFSFLKAGLAITLVATATFAVAQGADKYPGIGRAATHKEVKAWDIDVRPDFKGLPVGSGSVAKGQDVWEAKCSQCHGVFGDSNEFFSPLIGGTTADDVKTGKVAKLLDSTSGRTTLMKLATVSTLWDYINRAMPWTQPKSLSTEEVYAVTAFLLNLGRVVPDDFTLSDKNISEVQARMPNRKGMTTQHAMWPGSEFGGSKTSDVKNVACMKNCASEPELASSLPDFARNAHGNLAQQNRTVGAQRGADTSRPENKAALSAESKAVALKAASFSDVAAAPQADAGGAKAAQALLQKNNCTVCHAVDSKLIGPSFADIAKKHAGKTDYLASKIIAGSSGVWGPIPMPPQSIDEADAKAIAVWLAAGAAK